MHRSLRYSQSEAVNPFTLANKTHEELRVLCEQRGICSKGEKWRLESRLSEFLAQLKRLSNGGNLRDEVKGQMTELQAPIIKRPKLSQSIAEGENMDESWRMSETWRMSEKPLLQPVAYTIVSNELQNVKAVITLSSDSEATTDFRRGADDCRVSKNRANKTPRSTKRSSGARKRKSKKKTGQQLIDSCVSQAPKVNDALTLAGGVIAQITGTVQDITAIVKSERYAAAEQLQNCQGAGTETLETLAKKHDSRDTELEDMGQKYKELRKDYDALLITSRKRKKSLELGRSVSGAGITNAIKLKTLTSENEKLVKKNHELLMKQRTQGMFAVEMQKFVRDKVIFKDQLKMKAASLVRQKGRVRLLKARCKTIQRRWQHETYARRQAVKSREDLAVELQQKHSLMEKEASKHQYGMQQMEQQCDSLTQVNETLKVGLLGVSSGLSQLNEEVNTINRSAQVERTFALLQFQQFQNDLQIAHETTIAGLEQSQQDLAETKKMLEVYSAGNAELVELLAKKDKEKLELEKVMADERRKNDQDVKVLQKEINQKVESKNNRELLLTVRNNELVTTVVRLDQKIKILAGKHVKKMTDFKVNWATKMNCALLATNQIKSEKKKLEDKCKKMQEQLKISQVELDAKKSRIDQLEAGKCELQTRNHKLTAGLKRTKRVFDATFKLITE